MQAPFQSILFEEPEEAASMERPEAPTFFTDLNLDQVIDSITAGREQYDLKPFFYKRLHTVDSVHYRHEVFRDLEDRTVFGYVESFARHMQAMRDHLAQVAKLHYKHQKQAWFLDAVQTYAAAVDRFARDLTAANLGSRGLLAFRAYLTRYAESQRFISLVGEAKRLKGELAEIRYCINIKGSRVKVSKYEAEADYSAEVEETFEKFKQGAVKSYLIDFPTWLEMNHVEAAVLDLLAQLFPDTFWALDRFCDQHRDYVDQRVARFDREIQFYVAYLEYVDRLGVAGLGFCFPRVSDHSKNVHAHDTFDMALANKLVQEGSDVVCNDFYLEDPERIFVVTGPNQGGKTTFARTFGQLHHLASIGCPVPGKDVGLFLCDQLFTHFEKEEDLTNLRGKLEDDLIRIHEILEEATATSVVIMNESFTSTTLSDALFLGREVMRRLIQLGPLCVYVTFVDELASLSETTVSMVSTVFPQNPAQRTFKIVRRPADGLAYAAAIADKYGLTYEHLKERIAS